MMQLAAEDGVRAMVATPHSADWMPTDEDQLPRVQATIDSLQAEANRLGLPIILYPGSEIAVAPDLVAQLRQGQALSLCKGRYVLVELPFGPTPLYVDNLLFELQVEHFTPILAHPERHEGVMDNPNRLVGWVEKGNLAQINAGSILGHFGKEVQEVALLLLKHNLVHFIGSDGHNLEQRLPVMSPAVEVVSALVGEEQTARLTQVWPAAVIANQKIDVPPPQEVRRRRGFWSRILGGKL
jgi:protein-tyrosine phosphatase